MEGAVDLLGPNISVLGGRDVVPILNNNLGLFLGEGGGAGSDLGVLGGVVPFWVDLVFQRCLVAV